MDTLFARVSKLSWVSRTLPAVPSSSTGWGKRDKDYHLTSGEKDYCIEMYVEGKLVTSWKWNDQREVSNKNLSDEKWKSFIDGVTKEFPHLVGAKPAAATAVKEKPAPAAEAPVVGTEL